MASVITLEQQKRPRKGSIRQLYATEEAHNLISQCAIHFKLSYANALNKLLGLPIHKRIRTGDGDSMKSVIAFNERNKHA